MAFGWIVWIISVSCVIHLVTAAPSPPVTNTSTFWDIPTGHCEPKCTCQMDGIFYSEGEQWGKPEDPCVVFQCLKNGFFEPVKQGCLYKGACHDVGITWREGCNTFSCENGQAKPFYKLVEAGCSDTKGGCLKVGEQSENGCDVMECQLDGACLKLATVRTGCPVEGACKRLDTYWHDGCTIYTCTNEKDLPVKRLLANEKMQWPDGFYAMLKPKTGCPIDVMEMWTEGSRKHFGAGQNSFSKPLSLSGAHTPTFMTHEFCGHVTVVDNTILPRYKTYWEPGSYCILRSQGKCPRGFTDGFIQFDDNNQKEAALESLGSLPDGEFGVNTGLYFCCRNDSSVLKEIVLPKDDSFVLFMGAGKTECQTVRGMSHSVEFFSFDGTKQSKHVQNGTLPETKVTKGDVMLYFCHYKPMVCGCSDESGTFVPLNTEKEIDCVTKRCITENNFNVLEIVSGGCNDGTTCEKENAIWSTNHGEMCTKKTCKRVTTNTTTSFEVKKLSDGCRDNTTCKDLGAEINRGCYTSRCKIDPQTKKPAFRVTKADCPWQGACKPVNSTWQHGCMDYRCDMSVNGGHYQWNIEPIKYGCDGDHGECYAIGEKVTGQCYDAICKLSANKTVVYLDVTKGGCSWKNDCKKINATWKVGCHDYKCEWTNTDTGFTAVVNATNVSCTWNNSCYKQNDVWSDGCVNYTCIVTRQAEEVNWRVETTHVACKDFNGKCVEVGGSVTEKCVTYVCNLDKDRIGLDPKYVGCSLANGSCIDVNTTWTDDNTCVQYQCSRNRGPTGYMMQLAVVNYGCKFNNTCKPVNSTWPDGCRTRKCVVKKTDKYIQRRVAPIAADCDDEGTCRPVGFNKTTAMCMQYVCAFNDEFRDSFFSLSRGGCRASNGSCYFVDSTNNTWEEKRPSICVTFQCQKQNTGYLSKVIDQKCRDSNGDCQPTGSTGFPAILRGKQLNNCRCIKSPSGAGIAMRCKN